MHRCCSVIVADNLLLALWLGDHAKEKAESAL